MGRFICSCWGAFLEEVTMPMWNRARGTAWLSLGLGAAIVALAPSAAWAPSCNVVDFSAVKQRTQTFFGSDKVSTLVASPLAAPHDAVLLEADFGCLVGSGFDPNPLLNTVTVEVQKSVVDASGNGVFADPDLPGSFESFVVPGGDVTVLDCPPSGGCNALQFTMPDTGFAGPARITVTRGAEVVARIFEIGTRTASCDVDAPDTLFDTFTLLPPRNVLQASPTGVSNPALRGALAGNGSLLIPLEHFLFGAASVVATATTATGPEIDRIPNGNYLRALNHLGRPLPAIHRLIPFGANAKALFSTADVERSTLQVLQQDGKSPPPDDSYPDNFHDFRLGVATPGGSAGPVEFPNPVVVKFENASPLVSLRFNEETVAVGVSEELLGDRNADTDQSDLLLSATDLASGVTTDTGQAIAQVSASPRTPVVAVGGDVVAFLESEALSGHTDLNGDAEIDDLVLRVVKAAIPLNPGAPVNTSADPVRAIDGSQLAISDGFVFFRTAENATAPHTTARVSDASGFGGDDTSDDPSIDAAGARVAYATRAGNLAPGATGAHRQIVVTDLLSGVHELMSEGSSGQGNADSFDAALSADGEHVAFASDAGNLGGGAGGSQQVVWERGVNVEGHSAGLVSSATFELATGEEDVAGVDYSPCTASEPGLSITFAANGSVYGWLGPSSSGACSFFAEFLGTYAIAPAGPIQVGSIITVDAPLTSFDGQPGLPEGLEDLRLFSVNTVTDVAGPLFDFAGTFQLLASAGAASSTTQVYARSLDGSVELASAADGGGAGDGASTQPALSGDGALVAFASLAQNLVPGDGNGASDVFVRDRDGSSTARVSLTDGDAEANGASDSPALTPGGGLVAFASDASNLVGAGADANGARDVFVRDLAAASTELASVPAPGGSANGASTAPDLSDDGRFVVFESAAALVPEDGNGVVDVYLRDRLEGSTERVSTASGGEEGDDGSFGASLSGDGNFVVFASLASNLVPGAPPGTNVYRRNRLTGTVELLSEGASAGDTSTAPAANGNGLTVAFDSDASLVLNDSLPVDVFVRASGEGSDLNDDGDTLDTILQAFAANAPVPGLLPGARVAASFAATGAGRALVGVPEASESNTSRNGDPDALDTVLHLYEGASDVLVNLGVAGVGGAVSDLAVCALANEAQQGDLNNDGDTTDTVLMTGNAAALIASSASLTNTGIAASQTLAASSLCAFVAAEDQVLRFYDSANGKVVSTGLRATRFLVGPDESLIAFRVPEVGFVDLNNDEDTEDEVMHLVSSSAVFAAADGAVITTAVSNLGLQGIDCDLPACLALPLGSILGDGSVSFLGTEPGQTRDPDSCLLTNKVACDFNGDADGVDTVVHLVRTKPASSPPLVTATGTLALSSTFEQQASPFPVQAPNGLVHTLQIAECEAAVQGCGSALPQTGNIGPPLTYCESRYDTDFSGDLDCVIVRNFVGVDTDGDDIPDWFDPAELINNPAPSDIDKDGVDDEIDNDDNSQPPCLKSCDLNEDGCIDQDDVDAILGAVVAGGQTQGGTLSEVCSDRRDRDADRKISFLDASLCKADPAFEPDGCPAPPPSPPPAPPPASAPACGLGIELIGLLPLLRAARKRVSRKEKKFLA
jgi:Tol biopolymer transport system component